MVQSLFQRRTFETVVDRIGARMGLHAQRSAPFWRWPLDLALEIDKMSFTYEGRAYLRPLYEIIPERLDDLRGLDVSVMKASQLGLSVWEMLLAMYVGTRNRLNIGYYMPVQTEALDLSAKRFLPILASNPDLFAMVTDQGQKGLRSIGGSDVYFKAMRGTISTESIPLDLLCLDEVQGMTLPEIERVEERLSGRPTKAVVRISTAKYPEADIHHYFLRSDQREWHTRCGCQGGVVLSDCFPECVVHSDGTTPGTEVGWHYQCPECGEVVDPQDGEFVAHEPDHAPRVGFHVAHTLTWSAEALLQKYDLAQDKQNFFNRSLGMPWLDEERIPVRPEDLEKCVDRNRKWRISRGRDRIAGIDQMGRFNWIIIGEGLPDGRLAPLWVEKITDDDPFGRCSELIEQMGVTACCVESLPNYNDAHRFAKQHPGKVWLASYSQMKQPLEWGDRIRQTEGERKAADEAKDRYQVTIDQPRMMALALHLFRRKGVAMPPHGGQTTTLVERGVRREAHTSEELWLHLQRIAIIAEEVNEVERRWARRVEKVGLDPHGAFAWMLMAAAHYRRTERASIWTDLDVGMGSDNPDAEQLEQTLAPRLKAPTDAMTCDACGQCSETAMCLLRGFRVQRSDPACDYFVPR